MAQDASHKSESAALVVPFSISFMMIITTALRNLERNKGQRQISSKRVKDLHTRKGGYQGLRMKLWVP